MNFPVRRSPFDCQTCGACCCTAVEMRVGDRVPARLVACDASGRWWMKSVLGGEAPTGYRCLALSGRVGDCVGCTIYGDRPAVCRQVTAGGPMCLSARALFDLEGGELDDRVLQAAIQEALRKK